MWPLLRAIYDNKTSNETVALYQLLPPNATHTSGAAAIIKGDGTPVVVDIGDVTVSDPLILIFAKEETA